MKIKFQKSELLQRIIPAAAIAPQRNTLDILGELLFECPGENPGEVRITAYDNEKGLRCSVDAEIYDEGSFLINGQNLLQIVKTMPDGEIMLDIDENYRVKIEGGTSVFEIAAKSAENYPVLPLLSGDRNYKLKKCDLKRLIAKTIFATGQNASNIILSGVYFVSENGQLKMVGCDGTRLAYAAMDIDAAPDAAVVIPAKILSEIMRMLDDSEDEINVSLARKHVIFTIDGYVYFSRVIDGEYVNYKRIIPAAFERNAFVSRDEFMGAIERASIVSEDKLMGTSSAKTFLKLHFDENVVRITSTSTGGSSFDEIPAAITGDELIIGFNSRMLYDAVKACDDCTTLKLSMNGPLMGICIENGDDDREQGFSYLMFAMPLRMNGK